MKIFFALALVAASAIAQDEPAGPSASSQAASNQAAAAQDQGTSAQDLADKMLAASVSIFGMVKENGQMIQATQGAGFFLDAKTVVTSAIVCCTRTKGQMPQPRVVLGTQSEYAKVMWTSPEDGLAILTLDQPLGDADASAGVSVVPSKYAHSGQPVFAVQFPGPGEVGMPQVATGELQDLAPVEGFQGTVFHTSAPMDAFNAGGALFDACGNAVGVNWKSADGTQYAFTLDALLEQMDALGLSEKVADGPCQETLEAAASPWWRLPLGSQWIALAVMLVLVAGVGLWLGKRSVSGPKGG